MMSSVRTVEIAWWKGTLMKYLTQLFFLLSTVLSTAAFAYSGNVPLIRQRVVTLADRKQIHILEAGVPTCGLKRLLIIRLRPGLPSNAII